ncbi:MAG: hypothetical protein HN337_07155 [Deltaproteobacteria bacterium]|jgi:hypothetical protein|nr:hypothetical protein [Deltaproteobacteria bacterium]
MTENSDEKDIQALFEKISNHFKGVDDGAQAMFEMLVKTTLEYRDTLMHSSGVPFTVGETREALGVFMEVMKTQQMPGGLDKRIHDLVIIWLEGIKIRIQH